jgi:hypothetical protein
MKLSERTSSMVSLHLNRSNACRRVASSETAWMANRESARGAPTARLGSGPSSRRTSSAAQRNLTARSIASRACSRSSAGSPAGASAWARRLGSAPDTVVAPKPINAKRRTSQTEGRRPRPGVAQPTTVASREARRQLGRWSPRPGDWILIVIHGRVLLWIEDLRIESRPLGPTTPATVPCSSAKRAGTAPPRRGTRVRRPGVLRARPGGARRRWPA